MQENDHGDDGQDRPIEVRLSIPGGTQEDLLDLMRHRQEAGFEVRPVMRPEEQPDDETVLDAQQDHNPTTPSTAEIAAILRRRQREETEGVSGGLGVRWDNAEGYVDQDPDTAWITFPWMGKTTEIRGPEAAKLIRDDAEFRRNS